MAAAAAASAARSQKSWAMPLRRRAGQGGRAAQRIFPEFIEESGEYANARSSLLFSLATANQRMVDSLSVYDKLYIEQSMVIEELARKGNCVIVGRCADYILRDNESCLHIFIHADMESRAKRVIERYGANEKDH